MMATKHSKSKNAQPLTSENNPNIIEQMETSDKASKSDSSGFLRAVRSGNCDKVVDYLDGGKVDIHASNANGLNALHLAAKEGFIDIVKELLNRGCKADSSSKKGNTALHIAGLAGQIEVVQILVDHRADINIQSQAGFTPLYMASQENHANVVKYLLDKGADASLTTGDGFTPMAVAVQQGHKEVVDLLTEYSQRGKSKLSALHVAAKKNDVNAATMLLQNEQNRDAIINETTKSGFTPLHIASHYGNLNIAKLLVEYGANVNAKARNSITPLHVSSKWGRTPVVALLVDHGAVIDCKTRDGLTPLHCSSRSGYDEVVDLLLKRSAPMSSKTKHGLTALHMAAQGDHVSTARLLVSYKAPLDDVTVDYLTPLHVAAHCGNYSTAKLLLERKCEVNARALNGFTPLHIACKKNRIRVIELLLQYGATVGSTTESGLTPLHVASFMGYTDIVKFLLQKGSDPNAQTGKGETSLHLATRGNQLEVMKLLLDNGANVDATAKENQTSLHAAARTGSVEAVLLLLQYKASINATTKENYTPLHIAAKEGHDEVIQVLLERGADQNIKTLKMFTPLHIAAKYGNVKAANVLISNGANPNVEGKNGLTPLHVATHYHQIDMVHMLLEKHSSPHAMAKNGYTPMHIAAKYDEIEIATALLEYKAKPNAESKNGFTALHLASQEGHTDMVILLLDHKAKVNCQAKNGLTAMHLAAQEDHVPVAEILVKYRSEIDIQTKAGYTPLHTACHFGQLNMIQFLLEHRASVKATTKAGYTPLHQAAQQGHVLVTKILLRYNASPDDLNANGQTPMSIAEYLGFISVVEMLKEVTTVTVRQTDDKFKLLSPEVMQELDIGEDEEDDKAEETHLADQSYAYLTTGDDMRGFNDDSAGQNKDQDIFAFSDRMSGQRSQRSSVGIGPTQEDIHYTQHRPKNPEDRYSAEDMDQQFDSLIYSSGLCLPSANRSSDSTELSDSAKLKNRDEIDDQLFFAKGDSRYIGGETLETTTTTSSVEKSKVKLKKKKSKSKSEAIPLIRVDDDSSFKETHFEDAPEGGSDGGLYKDRPLPGDQFNRDHFIKGVDQGLSLEGQYWKEDGGVSPDCEGQELKNNRYHLMDVDDDKVNGEVEQVAVVETVTEVTRVPVQMERDSDTRPPPDQMGSHSEYRSETQVTTPVDLEYRNDMLSAPEYSRGHGIPLFKSNISETDSHPFGSTYSGLSYASSFDPDNVALNRQPLYSGFLVSFLVDARGGAMRGCRHSGIRIIIPPGRASMPTRVTCKLVKKEKVPQLPPLMEGEALASRVLVMGPAGARFLGPVIMEVPHFASLRGNEREIIVLRSENGQTWKEHTDLATLESVQKTLCGSFEDFESAEDLYHRRITRIVTQDFPKYFAIITRIRQEVSVLGPNGGIISSTVAPQVQVVFPPKALTKSIKLSLQAHQLPDEFVRKLCGDRVTISPIATIEPRRRKFHLPITVTLPLNPALIAANPSIDKSPSLRLLCSMNAGQDPTDWEDITGSTPFTLTNNCVSFTTTVSARFWLINTPRYKEAVQLATPLYSEAIFVPFMANFVVFAKRRDPLDGQLRIFSMTDDKMDKTLETQEKFVEVARSRDVEVLDGKHHWIEYTGNLLPVIKSEKSDKQPYTNFRAFKENRLSLNVRVRDLSQEPSALLMFMAEPRSVKGQIPVANLSVTLPSMKNEGNVDTTTDVAELQEKLEALKKIEIPNDDQISKAELRLTDIAEYLEYDWTALARLLHIREDEITKIETEYNYVTEQALVMLHLWVEKSKENASGNALERALKTIGRDDIIQKCIYTIEDVTDMDEKQTARSYLNSADNDLSKTPNVQGSNGHVSHHDGPNHQGPDHHGPIHQGPDHHGPNHHRPNHHGPDGLTKNFLISATKTPPSTPAERDNWSNSPQVTEDEIVASFAKKVRPEDLPMPHEYEDGGPVAGEDMRNEGDDGPPNERDNLLPNQDEFYEADQNDAEDEEDDDTVAVRVYTDTVEKEPEVETDVQEFEETLPDGTVIKRRVVKTKQKQTIIKRVVMEGPEDELPTNEEQAQEMLRQVEYDPTLAWVGKTNKEDPETSTDVQEYEETQPDGTVIKRRIVTTTQQQLTTERVVLEGDISFDDDLAQDEEIFEDDHIPRDSHGSPLDDGIEECT